MTAWPWRPNGRRFAPGRWAIAIGDATGTGPEAAALTARVRHTLAGPDHEPAGAVHSTRVELTPGDTLVLVTDGVLEARGDGAFFDQEGLERVLADPVVSASAAVTAVEQAVLDLTGGVLTDDMAAVVLHVPEGT